MIGWIIFQAFELKDKLQDKLKKTREETENIKKEVEQLQSKVNSSSVNTKSTVHF